MTVATSAKRLILVCLSLSVVLAPLSAKVWAQQKAMAHFEPPPGQGSPRGGTAGGGSRPVQTACLANRTGKSAMLTAVSPGPYVGLTQASRPNLLVYLPQTTAQTGEFSLFDDRMKGVYQTNLPISQQAGFVNLKLSDNAPMLRQSQRYYWTFAVVCNEADRTQDWVVGGWIQYSQVNPLLQQRLSEATPLEQVALYAQQGFWYDAVTTLVALERSQPSYPGLAATWSQLLQSVGLTSIANQKVSNPASIITSNTRS